MLEKIVQLGVCADSRLARKKAVALVRKLIRLSIKDIQTLSGQLKEPAADLWSIAKQLEAHSKSLAMHQATLNALLNRADEVQLLKRAANSTPAAVPDVVKCNYCSHALHVETCQETVLWSADGMGHVMEPCGCHG